MAIIKSISGLRFTLEELEQNPNLIKNYAKAFHHCLECGEIVIARDGRPSGIKILEQLTDELTFLGRDIILLDIVPTPTLQVFVEKHKAAGGICITASHNPENWNGLKFMTSKGVCFDEKQFNNLQNELDNNRKVEKCEKGTITKNKNAIAEHIKNVLSAKSLTNYFLIDKKNQEVYKFDDIIKNYIKNNKVKFVIDAVNSAGSVAVPMLLEKFGAEYEKLYCDNNGIFPHSPEPLPENLTALSNFIGEKSKNGERYIGIAVDPDADRLVLVDEDGNCISEEKTICIAIDSLFFVWGTKYDVIVNQSTTMLVDWIVKNYNERMKVLRSAVGEINVVNMMQKHWDVMRSVIGGEGSGGVILSDCHYGRDSLVGIVLLLNILGRKKITLKELINSYPQYTMLKKKYDFAGDKENLYNKIKKANTDYEISEIDGIKIYYEKGWVHIRTSNTEPIIRIIAEAEDENTAKEYLERIEKILMSF